MSEGSCDSPAGGKSAPSGNAATVLTALAVTAVANLLATLALGGYEFEALGMSVKSSHVGRPLLIALVILAARWLVGLRALGLANSLRSLVPGGAAVAAGGLALFAYVVWNQDTPLPPSAAVMVGAALLLGFAFAWMSRPRASTAAGRVVVTVLFVILCAAVGRSLAAAEMWKKAFPVEENPFANIVIPADRDGLLFDGGSRVRFEKVRVGEDWRDTAVVPAGGFCAGEVEVTAGDRLRFSTARRGPCGGCTVTVTAVTPGGNRELWTAGPTAMSEGEWREVTVGLDVSGAVKIEFAVEGGDGAGEMLFANARIEGARETAGNPPNVVLILVDALRPDRMGLYGYAKGTTAEIDSLAAGAAVFEECLAQAPWTLPSMSSLLTSLFPSAHGAVNWASGLGEGLDSVAEQFRKGGYFTGAIQTNVLLAPGRGTTQGFNTYHYLPAEPEVEAHWKTYKSAAVLNDLATGWLEEHSAGPFFLYLHYMDLHEPFLPPEEFKKFGTDESGLYDAEIAYFSSQFGRLFEFMRSEGLVENTIIVLTSDHGQQFREHGGIYHGNCLHGEELRVPLILWLPGDARSRRIEGRAAIIDIAPTLLEIAGLPALPRAQGVSLSKALQDGRVEERPIFGELTTYRPAGQFMVSLTKGDYRFIASNPGMENVARYELYDLSRDGQEYVNIASRRRQALEDMKREMAEYLAAQQKLSAEILPDRAGAVLTEEQIEEFKSLGYLMP